MLNFLPGSEVEGKGDSLPILRDWVKERIASGIEVYEIPVSLRQLKLSTNEDWVVCSSNEFVALVSTKSLLGKSLLDLIETLTGEGNQLVILPKKSGKLGFAIAVDTDLKAYYSRQKEYVGLWIANSASRVEEKPPTVSLKDLIQPVSPNVSVTDTDWEIRNGIPQDTNGTKATSRKGNKQP